MNVSEPQGGFAHNWQARVLEKPPLIAPARHFTYPQQVPGEEDALARGALLVEVRPATGGTFLATCALGFRESTLPSGVWPCPAPDDLLAVAGGYAYLVNTRQPERAVLLEQRPVVEVRSLPAKGLLLLAGFHTILAVDDKGIAWTTARLSWEGITLGHAAGGELHGTGWDMFTDRDVPFVLDLQTGQHTGGGYAVGG